MKNLTNPATLALPVLLAGLYVSYRGLGLPNHPYQWTLGGLTVALAYHRRWLGAQHTGLALLLAGLNTFQFAILYKLIIGSGHRRPLAWLEYPNGFAISSMSFTWQNSQLAAWEVDLTLIQTFLLMVTIVGALFRFQPFTSLTAILLLAVSLPAFSGFAWMWVFPAMMLACVAIYLQSPLGQRPTAASDRRLTP